MKLPRAFLFSPRLSTRLADDDFHIRTTTNAEAGGRSARRVAPQRSGGDGRRSCPRLVIGDGGRQGRRQRRGRGRLQSAGRAEESQTEAQMSANGRCPGEEVAAAAVERDSAIMVSTVGADYNRVASTWSGDGWEDPRDRDGLPIFTAGDLITVFPLCRTVLIEGLLRRGETMNLIAASKVGKSWLTYLLAFSVALGRKFLDTFDTTAGNVLIIDNELHPETIAHRLRTVASALSIPLEDFAERVDVLPLRGRLKNLDGLRPELLKLEPGRYCADHRGRLLPGTAGGNGREQQRRDRPPLQRRRFDCRRARLFVRLRPSRQ